MTTRTYSGASAPQSFVVPTGVASLTLDLYGAAGSDRNGNLGGRGGHVQTVVAVTPGEVLQVRAGQLGSGTGSRVFGGGGAGDNLSGGCAGGGGASDIRRSPYGSADRLAVAGGGGGAGYFARGGVGGGLVGGDGQGSGFGGTSPGLGGTQTAGGLNGNGDPSGDFDSGGDAIRTNVGGYGQGSSGGGGGWYGGGAGGPNGWNEGAPGGGGSSYSVAAMLVNDQDVQSNNGSVVITYDDPVPTGGGDVEIVSDLVAGSTQTSALFNPTLCRPMFSSCR